MRRVIITWVLAFILSGIGQSVSAQSAREIMERVDAQQREVAHETLILSRLSSCEFARGESGVVCTETPRMKLLESYSRQQGEELKDSQSISIILEPASERGVGMLTYSYDDANRNTESWLYLSALGKVKRMVTGNSDDQEPVSFFGSEFTTEDMENGKTDEYDYRILQSGAFRDRQVWVIEAIPRPVRLAKTRYSKLYIWVDQERYLPIKMQAYDRRGQLWKRMSFERVESLNNLWLARRVTLFNLQNQRLSTMETAKIAQGVSADDGFLTQRTLVDFAYREQVLQQLRRHFE